ncbi:recombinase family protein [Caulobacter sp. FWC2]|uniref:recombinase family protein n=1 Tax=Caulobacter sp. FWC2 TaxID=69664 RepID=UPI000C15B88C|nr:recombinase family protein [Caulobacter sp. FWC2]PIB91012.1 hypothetical protein CSW62_05155 [Caulobacter sp. FWC2]
MTDAYIYIRFSTPSQEDGHSYERQYKGGMGLIAEKGWTLVETVEDLGKSAWKGKHLNGGELGKFSDRVRAGDIAPGSWLIAEKTDRLSRQGWEELFDWLRDMTRKGLNVITQDNHVFTQETMRDTISVIRILLEGQADKAHSDKISDRVSKAYNDSIEKARNGGPKISKKCPGWLELSEDRMTWIRKEDRIAVVQMIYEAAAEGKGSRWIAKELNERGVLSWGGARRKLGGGWDATTVRWLLTSEAVEGHYVVGAAAPKKVKDPGRRIDNYFPEIVDADLVARARAAVDGRRLTGGRDTSNVVNLFRGVVRCQQCEKPMRLTNFHGVHQFHCANWQARRGCTNSSYFMYQPFEDKALDLILTRVLDDRYFSRADDTYPLTVEVAERKNELDEAQARLDRAVDQIINGANPEIFEARIPGLKQGLTEAQSALRDAEQRLLRARGSVSADEHRRRVLEVRDSITHEDKETRVAARLRVMQALKSYVDVVWCNGANEWEGEEHKTFALHLTSSSYIAVITDEGRVLMEQNFLDEIEDDDDMENFAWGDAKTEKHLTDLIRREKQG